MIPRVTTWWEQRVDALPCKLRCSTKTTLNFKLKICKSDNVVVVMIAAIKVVSLVGQQANSIVRSPQYRNVFKHLLHLLLVTENKAPVVSTGRVGMPTNDRCEEDFIAKRT